MNKKAIIICVASLLALAAVVMVSVAVLYSGTGSARKPGDAKPVAEASDYKLLPAVPSDAAMLLCFSSMKKGVETLADSSHILGSLVYGSDKRGFGHFIKLLAASDAGYLEKEPAVISLHYSGELVPLMIVHAGTLGKKDSSLIGNMLQTAAAASIHAKVLDSSETFGRLSASGKSGLLLFSPSETLITASERHLEGGVCVLDKEGFDEAAKSAGGADAIFISHGYAGKLMSRYFVRPYSGLSPFFADMASWTALSMREISGDSFSLKGSFVCSDAPSYFCNVLAGSRGGESALAGFLPADAVFALSLPFADVRTYMDGYRKYMDASGKLSRYRSALSRLKDTTGINPEMWAEQLDLKEVARAVLNTGEGLSSVILIRPGKADASLILKGTGRGSLKECKDSVLPFAYPGFASALFGDMFSLQGEHMFTWRDGWVVVGDSGAVRLFAGDRAKEKSVRALIEEAGLAARLPGKGTGFFAYLSAKGHPSVPGDVLRPFIADALGKAGGNTSFFPLTMTVSGKDISLSADKAEVSLPDSGSFTGDTVVRIPSGPFRVKNSGTGRMNLFGQSANLSLTLKEENGKGLWAVPFGSPICGAAPAIDYFANGKLQILFASGSSLYLIDRLGRMVKPFPVDLGKKILLGPAIYDFTGAKGYTVLVLHQDNTIGMYNLRGRKPEDWKGIAPKEKIIALPEILEVSGKKYWVVRTSVQTLIFGFYGGEPVVRNSGARMIRPDSEISVNDGRISAVCIDGKTRTFKL